MRVSWLVPLWIACATESIPRPEPSPIKRVAGRCPDAPEVIDALGEKVRLGTNPDRLTTVVVLFSRSAAEDASDLIRQLDERLLNGPVQMVGVVDLRKYAHVFRSVAERQLKKSAAESRDRRRERRQKRGVDASPTFVDRWHVIGDFDGSLLLRFHVDPDPSVPVAYVVGSCGQVSGPFHDVEGTLRAVNHASSRSARRPADSRASRRLRAAK
jgi:hypothetical protein